MSIAAPLPIETSIAEQLRHKALNYIDSSGLNTADLAAKLDVAPETARLLLSRERWDMHLALSIADQLGIRLTIT